MRFGYTILYVENVARAIDVPAGWDAALAAGATVVAPPETKPWGQTVAYVRDLEGMLVEICTPVTI